VEFLRVNQDGTEDWIADGHVVRISTASAEIVRIASLEFRPAQGHVFRLRNSFDFFDSLVLVSSFGCSDRNEPTDQIPATTLWVLHLSKDRIRLKSRIRLFSSADFRVASSDGRWFVSSDNQLGFAELERFRVDIQTPDDIDAPAIFAKQISSLEHVDLAGGLYFFDNDLDLHYWHPSDSENADEIERVVFPPELLPTTFLGHFRPNGLLFSPLSRFFSSSPEAADPGVTVCSARVGSTNNCSLFAIFRIDRGRVSPTLHTFRVADSILDSFVFQNSFDLFTFGTALKLSAPLGSRNVRIRFDRTRSKLLLLGDHQQRWETPVTLSLESLLNRVALFLAQHTHSIPADCVPIELHTLIERFRTGSSAHQINAN
jgi:hypothetical protein